MGRMTWDMEIEKLRMGMQNAESKRAQAFQPLKNPNATVNTRDTREYEKR